MRSTEDFMRRCIDLARSARQNGDAPVGALIVHAGRAVAEGIESVKARLDISAHAEIEAIRNACRVLGSLDLSGCALYTTTEPCWMCSYAIRRTGIRQVFIGAPVSDVGGATSRYPILSEAKIGRCTIPPAVAWSNLRKDCEALWEEEETTERLEGL